MRIRNIFVSLLLAISLVMATAPAQEVKAIIPIAKIIKEAIKKVIKAVDLMIQRLQNKTIWLQNAQRELENALSKLKLKEIAEWSDKHRELYRKYYDELWTIKNTLATYQRIKQIIERQVKMVELYRVSWERVSKDKNFTEAEIDYMYRVLTGMLRESVRNVDQLLLLVDSYKVQMTDAQRLRIITETADRIEKNFIDLLEFNMQTGQLSISRERSQAEISRIKKLYGI
ncbi:conjugal transfer protein TraI [Parachryseolinea silvisoli]|uniref:conjugal transfer protein TraI n=1 Tax=Parachryseolinea silvisoli TaxID=2873601 RepID=UPI002265DCAE|nr:conjugal transfer protein TraI [Parachryseolinea silvisoli]MCD9015228.1 conjugal transfer protein TraI [Parachryseolinea silvisoli]